MEKPDIARARIEEQQKSQVGRFDSRHPAAKFEDNDYVMLFYKTRHEGKSERLEDRKVGPFRVMRVFPNNTVEVGDATGNRLTVSRARLQKVYKRLEGMRTTTNEQEEESEPLYED